MAKIRKAGDARRIWQRFGLAVPIGSPDHLFENAEALLKLEEKHAQELTTARQDAARDAYEQVIRLADGYDVPCDPRTEAEETAHQIVRGIRALAAAEAGEEDK
jgi:hypothetical protein